MREGPRRIQRRRTKGWRMPKGSIYVGRPSTYGNPFTCPPWADRSTVVELFRAWLEQDTLDPRAWSTEEIVRHIYLRANLDRGVLRGKDLACWCPLDSPCHADVLLDLANRSAS